MRRETVIDAPGVPGAVRAAVADEDASFSWCGQVVALLISWNDEEIIP